MAYAYKPPHSKTWRIGFKYPVTGKKRSISAKTTSDQEAKKIANDESARMYCIEIDIPIKHYTLHQIRKTRGTKLANSGIDCLFLQQFMRHENFANTQQYYIK